MDRPYGLFPQISERYQHSISLIERTFSDPGSAIYTLLPQCEQAREYDWREPRQQWDDDQAARDDAQHAGRSARALADYLTRYKSKLGFTVADAVNRHPMQFKQGSDVIDTLAAVLSELDDSLTQDPPKISAKRGPLLHRVRYGPLIYPDAIDNRGTRQLPSPHTAHILYMVFINRWMTSHEPGALWSRGQPMPSEGQPKYDVAAALADDTFGGETTADDARNKVKAVLRRTPNIGFYGY